MVMAERNASERAAAPRNQWRHTMRRGRKAYSRAVRDSDQEVVDDNGILP
jgi:hypothetical protein